jgi:hypothetical protein
MQRVIRIDILQSKFSVGHSEGFGKLARPFYEIFGFLVVHRITSLFPPPSRQGEKLAILDY